MILADITLIDLIWWTIGFFFLLILISMVFQIIGDVLRSTDLSGVGKAGWLLLLLAAPWLMVFVYLIVRGGGMAERSMQANAAARAQFDAYVRETAGGGGAAAEIKDAKELLDAGAISSQEFEQIKAKALAAS